MLFLVIFLGLLLRRDILEHGQHCVSLLRLDLLHRSHLFCLILHHRGHLRVHLVDLRLDVVLVIQRDAMQHLQCVLVRSHVLRRFQLVFSFTVRCC